MVSFIVTNLFFIVHFIIIFLIMYLYYRMHNYTYIKYTKKFTEFLQKIEDIKKIYHPNKNLELHYHFLKNFQYIFKEFQPFAMPIFYFKHSNRTNIINIKFLFELKIEKNITVPIFESPIHNIPISTVNFITDNIKSKDELIYINDINIFKDKDNQLYTLLLSKGITNLYVINIYDNDVYLGFFALLYKNKAVELSQFNKQVILDSSKDFNTYIRNL